MDRMDLLIEHESCSGAQELWREQRTGAGLGAKDKVNGIQSIGSNGPQSGEKGNSREAELWYRDSSIVSGIVAK